MKSYQYVLVVPAHSESYATVRRLLDSVDPQALTILVINRAQGADSARIPNSLLSEELCANASNIRTEPRDSGCLWLLGPDGKADVLLVDRSSEGREIIGGVGMARRIGCDIAFIEQREGQVASKWIHNTDCDTILPADYFAEADKRYVKDSSLCVRALEAFSDDDPQANMIGQLSEVSARIAMVKFEKAGCPWTLRVSGCGLAISHWAYEVVGGMQPYEFSEDATLVGSGGKIGLVHRVYGERLRFEARPISRTPTGFGQNVKEGKAKLDEGKGFTATPPAAWLYISAFYAAIRSVIGGSKLRAACEDTASEAQLDTALIEDCILRYIGPLDVMLGPGPRSDPAQTFLAVHQLMDMRRVNKLKTELIDTIGVVPFEQAFASAGITGTIDQMLTKSGELEASKCSGDTGPLALSRRLQL